MDTSEPIAASRAQDLDQALLFLSSFLTFVLALGFNLAFKPDLLQFSILIPPLLVVGIMPVYVGYMRGTIEQHSVRERARGWVFLLFGLGWYAITVADAPVVLGSDLVLKYLAGFVVTPLLLALLGFTKRFVLWFYKIQGISSVPISDKIGIFSVVSGLFVSSFFYQALLGRQFGRTLNNQPFVYDPLIAQLVSLGEGIAFLFPLVVLEVKSHHCLDEAASLFETYRPKVRLKPRAPKWAVNVIDLVLLVLFPFLLGLGARGSGRFLFTILASLSLVLAGIFSAAYVGWIGVLILFGGDVLLSFTVFFHFREIWRRANSTTAGQN